MTITPVRSHPRARITALALAAILAASTAACSSSGVDTSTAAGTDTTATTGVAASVRHLDPAAFEALVAQPGTVLIDVRTSAEYATGHLPHARNLDMRGTDFAAQLSTLDKSASYALYCHSGNRSNAAAQQMLAAGFTTVADLAGGITAWTATGHPVETS